MEEMNTGNSSAPQSQDEAVNGVFDSQDTFFDDLEKEVNGQVYDNEPVEENAQQTVDSPQEVTYQQDQSQASQAAIDWEKRYKDSSREAQRMAGELNQLRPFAPVLNAMRKDRGLVDHVRGYFDNGGKPAKSVKEAFNLDEDFVFDAGEAMENPESDSGKVFNAYMDKMVQKRVSDTMLQQQKVNQQRMGQARKVQEEKAFKNKTGMSDSEYNEMVQKAKNYKITLDDINFLVNRDKANKNVADNTRQDMLNQMKNVRNMPTTASGTNSVPTNQNPDDGIFDTLMDVDSDLDNLFG